MLAVRSFFLVLFAVLYVTLVSARSDPLHPARHEGHLSHESTLLPQSRSPRALLRARQAVLPGADEFVAAHAARARREAVAQLDRARTTVEEVAEDVVRSVERMKRSLGGAREASVLEQEGTALHDTLFHLLDTLSSSTESSSLISRSGDEAIVAGTVETLPDATVHRAPAPSVSPQPVPSGRPRNKRALPARQDRDLVDALSALLSTLDRSISSPVSDVLPRLPPLLSDSVRALLESLEEESVGRVERALLVPGLDAIWEVATVEQMRLGTGVAPTQEAEQRLTALRGLLAGNVTGP